MKERMEKTDRNNLPDPQEYGLDEASLAMFRAGTKPFIILPSALGWLSFLGLWWAYPIDFTMSWGVHWLKVPFYFLPGVVAGAGINSLRRLSDEKKKTQHRLYPNYLKFTDACSAYRNLSERRPDEHINVK
jgi:hypothetical protein